MSATLLAADSDATPLDHDGFVQAANTLYAHDWPAADALPVDSTFAALSAPKSLAPLLRLPDLRVVYANELKAPQIEALAELPQVEVLCIARSPLPNLRPLRGARNLRHLVVFQPRKFDALDGIEALPALTTLHVDDAPRLKRLPSHDGSVRQLRGLVLQEGWNSRMKVQSLKPLAALHRLEYFEFWGTVEDASLWPLHALRHLRHVDFSPRFSIEQVAALRAAFPRLQSARLDAYAAANDPCDCGSDRVRLAGRGGRTICPRCQAHQLQRHVAKFEELVARGADAVKE